MIHIHQRGFRIHTLVIATTLLDPQAYSKEDLAQLYRARWNAELDLRSLKQTLQMDILRCQSPELVRKEIWTDPHLGLQPNPNHYRAGRCQARG
jgi:IS4 transposase